MAFPARRRTRLHGANPIERPNKEAKPRTDVVGLRPRPLEPVAERASLPNEASIARLIGAVLFERNDERAPQHRYMQVEPFSKIDTAEVDPILSITTEAARS